MIDLQIHLIENAEFTKEIVLDREWLEIGDEIILTPHPARHDQEITTRTIVDKKEINTGRCIYTLNDTVLSYAGDTVRKKVLITPKVGPGLKEILKTHDGKKSISLEDLQNYLMNIFTNIKDTDKDIVIGKYCPHLDRIVALSSNPNKNQCPICYGLIVAEGLKQLNLPTKTKKKNE